MQKCVVSAPPSPRILNLPANPPTRNSTAYWQPVSVTYCEHHSCLLAFPRMFHCYSFYTFPPPCSFLSTRFSARIRLRRLSDSTITTSEIQASASPVILRLNTAVLLPLFGSLYFLSLVFPPSLLLQEGKKAAHYSLIKKRQQQPQIMFSSPVPMVPMGGAYAAVPPHNCYHNVVCSCGAVVCTQCARVCTACDRPVCARCLPMNMLHCKSCCIAFFRNRRYNL
jgi:hypothetical protein